MLAAVLLGSACSEPPTKEMHQAQGAIDAARAAGAEEYASADFTAAVEALRKYDEAVSQRDYRLALSLALDARERAQEAAKQAATQKAAVRSEAERLAAEVTEALSDADHRLKQAVAARTPADRTAEATRAIDAARQALQEARALLGSDRYLQARDELTGVAERLKTISSALPAESPSQPARRRR